MTRKDYVTIAWHINRTLDTPDIDLRTVHILLDALCSAFQFDNPAFDREKFTRKCFE